MTPIMLVAIHLGLSPDEMVFLPFVIDDAASRLGRPRSQLLDACMDTPAVAECVAGMCRGARTRARRSKMH